MFWYGPSLAFGLSSLVFWVLVAVAIIALVRFLSRDGQRVHHAAPAPGHMPSPEQILAERFARGEIGEDEFHQRMAALRAEAPPRP